MRTFYLGNAMASPETKWKQMLAARQNDFERTELWRGQNIPPE